jgi:sec-independent protein translocase protein TatA
MFRSPFADGVVVIVILLLFFGPKRLPMLSRSIGESVKEFKGGISHGESDEDEKPEIAATAPEAVPTSHAVPETEAKSASTEHTNA